MSTRPTNNEAVEGEPGRQPPAGLASLRLRIDLSYDGSAFHGWAAQPGLATVQQTLEEALWRVLALPEKPSLTVAGRTDTGVHARGQVAHADVPAVNWTAAAGSAARRLGRILPPEIRVAAIRPAPDGFDARFSAVWRRYSYRVCDDPALADPLRRYDTLLVPPAARPRPDERSGTGLRRQSMTSAAFCRRREVATTIREVFRLDWVRTDRRRGRRDRSQPTPSVTTWSGR